MPPPPQHIISTLSLACAQANNSTFEIDAHTSSRLPEDAATDTQRRSPLLCVNDNKRQLNSRRAQQLVKVRRKRIGDNSNLACCLPAGRADRLPPMTSSRLPGCLPLCLPYHLPWSPQPTSPAASLLVFTECVSLSHNNIAHITAANQLIMMSVTSTHVCNIIYRTNYMSTKKEYIIDAYPRYAILSKLCVMSMNDDIVAIHSKSAKFLYVSRWAYPNSNYLEQN